ncbi:ATP-binding protein, partial [Candidatus Woesearchaeota archaeon]|nr:ATP-binding protein [Candidatus Woesearchaeota archaeon]
MAEAPIAELEYEINHARRKIGDYLPHTLLLVEDSVPAAAARQAFATCLGVQQYVKQALSKQNHYPGEFLNAASTWIGADIAARIVQPYAEKRDAIYAALDYSIGDSSLAHALGMHAQQLLRQGTNGDISTLCDAYFSGLKEQSQRLLEGKYPTELRELQETTLTLHLPPGLVKLLKQDTLAYTGLSSSPAILPSALPHITFADIGGNRSAKERLQEAVKDFQAREKRKFWGLSVEKNYLLFGPPGTGKTILAYAYAAALGLDAKELSMAEIYDPYIGKTEQKLREAMQMPEGVLIVNELDSFLRKKALQDNQVFVNVVNLFAIELDRRKEDDAFHCLTTANE